MKKKSDSMKKDLLLLLALVIIAWLVVGIYQDLLEVAQQLRAGQIDGGEALNRVIGAVVNLADDTLPDWGPIERQMGKRTDQVQEKIEGIIEAWIRNRSTWW